MLHLYSYILYFLKFKKQEHSLLVPLAQSLLVAMEVWKICALQNLASNIFFILFLMKRLSAACFSATETTLPGTSWR